MLSEWSLLVNCLHYPTLPEHPLCRYHSSLAAFYRHSLFIRKNSLHLQLIQGKESAQPMSAGTQTVPFVRLTVEETNMSVRTGHASGTWHLPYHFTGRPERKKRWMWQQQAQMHYYHRDICCSLLRCDSKRIRSVKAEQQSLMSSAAAPHPG